MEVLNTQGKTVWCNDCQSEMIVAHEAKGGICSNCTQKRCLALLTDSERNKLFGVGVGDGIQSKPRGWRWMSEFVDSKGNVYHKGTVQPDLKGTRPVTDIVAIKAKQKANKEKRLLAEKKKLLKMDKERKAVRRAIKKQKDFLDHKVEGKDERSKND